MKRFLKLKQMVCTIPLSVKGLAYSADVGFCYNSLNVPGMRDARILQNVITG
jgi:hypothetical protein